LIPVVPFTPFVATLNWTFSNTQGSVSFNDPSSPVKRIYSPVPIAVQPSLNGIVVTVTDELPADAPLPLPAAFLLYRRAAFTGGFDTPLEDLKMSFTVDQSWLAREGVSADAIVAFTDVGQAWRQANVTVDENGNYLASFRSAPLKEIVFGAIAPGKSLEGDALIEIPVVEESAGSLKGSSVLLIAIVAVVILAGVLFAIFHGRGGGNTLPPPTKLTLPPLDRGVVRQQPPQAAPRPAQAPPQAAPRPVQPAPQAPAQPRPPQAPPQAR
jgi:hypothetical protein